MASFKLSTIVHSTVPNNTRYHFGFSKPLRLLSDLVHAQYWPSTYTGPEKRAFLDEFLFPGTEEYEFLKQALRNATRVELTILPIAGEDSRDVYIEIAFFHGAQQKRERIVMRFNLDSKEYSPGILGSNGLRSRVA